MEVCKAPTPRLKALNKHNTHNVHGDRGCYPHLRLLIKTKTKQNKNNNKQNKKNNKQTNKKQHIPQTTNIYNKNNNYDRFPLFQAPSEPTRRRTTSVLSESAPKVSPANRSSLSIFRLVAATRTWQRLAKRKRESFPPPVKYENTYQLEPDAHSKFSPARVEAILKDVLESRLKNISYDPEQCRRVATDLVSVIKSRTKTCGFRRYKLVCNVLIMENKGQGTHVASRGLFNTDTDSFAAYTYRNATLIAVAHVYGLYFE